MKDIFYIIVVLVTVMVVVRVFQMTDSVISKKNDPTTQVAFNQSRHDIQEIPNDDVRIVYFRDSAAELCYALLQGTVPVPCEGIIDSCSYSLGSVVVVPCDKALWSSITQ